MEHATSRKVLDRLVAFVEYFDRCPLNETRWDEEIGFTCGNSRRTMVPTDPATDPAIDPAAGLLSGNPAGETACGRDECPQHPFRGEA